MNNTCVQQIEQQITKVFWDSGRFIQQFGLYQQCNLDGLDYTLSLVQNSTTGKLNGLYMGLCLPYQCSVDNYSFIRYNLNQFLGVLSKELKVGPIFDNPQNIQVQKKWLYYPTLVLIVLLLCLTLLSTYLNRFPKFRNRPSPAVKLLDSFNLEQTFKIFKHKHNVFNVFNGVKSICMFWVILGHEFSVRLHNNVNALDMNVQVQNWFFLFVLSAFFAVDVFFFLGGFLVAYSFMREKSKNPLKYPMAIVHRILRFWPSYLMAILILYAVFLQTGSGIFWFDNQATAQIDYCADIWKPMFFVDNLVDNGQKMCMGWGWYLQNDMQIFIISIGLLFLYSYSKIGCKISLLVLSLLSLILNFIQANMNQYVTVTHQKDFAKWSHYFPDIYIKPWTRCPPYLLGLFFGIHYMQYIAIKKIRDDTHKQQQSKQMNRTSLNEDSLLEPSKNLPNHFFVNLRNKMTQNKYLIYMFQIFGLVLMLFVILIPRTLQQGGTWPQPLHSLYLSLGKVVFVMGMFSSVLPSLLDIPNFTFFIMDTKFFNFISKISFWTYLIHYMVVMQIVYRQKIDFYFKIGDIMPLYFPTVIISLFFGFIGTITVEVPFAKMQKILLNKLMGKKKLSKNVQKVGSITQPLVQSFQSQKSQSDVQNQSFLTGSIKSQQTNEIQK